MLSRVKPWHHVVVGFFIVSLALLAGFRVIGAGDDSLFRPESFDSKQVTIWPDGDDGVRIREVVDVDFGLQERRGYQRIIPNDFGVPESISVVTEANDTLNIVDIGGETRIRVGDPAVTFTGRHRYVLEYVLPDAAVGSGVLALDVIGHDETFTTDRFEVVLTGFDFSTTSCDTGSYGSFGGCELSPDDSGRYVTVIEPLEPNDGITVGGRIDGFVEVDLPAVPDQPGAAATGFAPLGLLMIPIGVAGAGCAFLRNRRRGSNDVSGAGGAADAAFGGLPDPGRAGAIPYAVRSTRRVSDKQLAQMATIEFVPPRGLEPWQGMALLGELVDDRTVLAWFSDMVAQEALVVTGSDGEPKLALGPKADRASLVDQAHLARLFASEALIDLGTYNTDFAATWSNVADEQKEFVKESGWWNTRVSGGGGVRTIVIAVLVVVFFFVFFPVGAILAAAGVGTLSSVWFAVLLGFFVPFFVGILAYRSMLPSRTATGSALALRTESFRRFLSASEGRHVDWAWEHGVLRDYSAWAVALGAAEAWSKAIGSSNIPDPTSAMAGPMLVHTMGTTFASTHVAPSTSSSGSSGGFSGGGFSGGGGGGGSSGSW